MCSFEFIMPIVTSSDEFELKFPQLNWAELWNQTDKFSALVKNHNQIIQFWACTLIVINFIVSFMNFY